MDGIISDIENKPPKRAAILKMNIEPVEEAEEFTEFAIIESEKTKGETFVSPDIAICDECKEEMFDPKNRRYLHPFINCTCCGPRLTILDALPYDRERTSMKEFPMCPDCAKEYYDPATRRYDAQPVCCNECGLEDYLIGREERGRDAIIYTRRTIAEGGISDMIEMVENQVYLAQGAYAKVIGRSEGLLAACAELQYALVALHLWIQTAAAYAMLGKTEEAQALLLQALQEAEPDEFLLPFVENYRYIKNTLE